MALTTVTAASTRWLTTIEALEGEIGAETVQANLVHYERLIASASAAIERYCGRIFAQQRYTETLPGHRGVSLFLRYWPIIEVDSITDGTTPVTDYRIDFAEAGVLYRQYGWGHAASGEPWAVTYVGGYILPGQINAPEPTGEALPADIEAAALEAIKVWYHESNPDMRITSREFGDQRITYSIQSGRAGLPAMATHLLASWRRVVLV